jgi:hypothetical protein
VRRTTEALLEDMKRANKTNTVEDWLGIIAGCLFEILRQGEENE